MTERNIVKISTPFIKLGDFMKFSGIAENGGQAKLLIQNGAVTVNGQVCTERGKKLRPGDEVCCEGQSAVVG